MGMILTLLRVSSEELEHYLNDKELLTDRIFNDDGEDPKLVDIDKAWDGIIFLLTGERSAETQHPLARILFSGNIISEDQDLGYGPAHYLTAVEVQALNNALVELSEEEVASKYDGNKMAALNIYPSNWESEEEKEYLMEYFIEVKSIYAQAAENGEAIITFLN